jgi:hypothetical protein
MATIHLILKLLFIFHNWGPKYPGSYSHATIGESGRGKNYYKIITAYTRNSLLPFWDHKPNHVK